MLSRVPERKMLSVRGLLLLAWFILIASLFWDPYSVSLTNPSAIYSPFRITTDVVHVQNDDLRVSPYSMGARIFWTMIVPIVPFYLMVFGHEAWRRVCPLSLASQIPGFLGLRRSRKKQDRKQTGIAKPNFALIERQSWLARNSWYVQFGLLFAGISTRLLIINSDRQALGIALLVVIGAAMLTGVLWGGKTWCNYFCPANVVQKIYTEPGGIFESSPHFSRPALPQSMCRKPSAKGDVSACVGCAAVCGDIDLQRSYWSGVLDPQRRNVYYMFFGLIIGFYGYYYLYSGNWDYYFSGVWTHEDGVRQKLLAPGFFILGHTIAIPKLIAAPLTLASACAIALMVGRVLEALYRKVLPSEEGVSEEVIVHQCLSISAWLSINAFYIFGGRPNILLLPTLGARVVDIAIVALTTIWLRRALMHSPSRYQQESMASSLIAELKKLKVDVAKLLDGRRLESLKPNEIYLMSKVLPGFSQHQKLGAYRKILDEAVTRGNTASTVAVKLLEDFRNQMNITEEEHTKLLEELSLANTDNEGAVTAEEKAASLNYYRSILSSTVASRLGPGVSVIDVLQDPALQSTIDVLRQSLQIAEQDHQAIIEALSKEFGVADTNVDDDVEALRRLDSIRPCMEAVKISDPLGGTLMSLLLDALDAHQQGIQINVLSAICDLGPGHEARRHAEALASLSGHDLSLTLRQTVSPASTRRWRDTLEPDILAILSRGTAPASQRRSELERRPNGKMIPSGEDVERNLIELVALDDPLIRAIGLVICGYLKPALALEVAERMLVDQTASGHSLLLSTAEYMVDAAAVWHPGMDNGDIGSGLPTILQLAMLAKNYKLAHLPLDILADIASRSRAERYARGAKLEAVLGEERYFLIHEGQIKLFDPIKADFLPNLAFESGDLIDSDLINLRSSAFGSGDLIDSDLVNLRAPAFLKVASDFAIVLHVPPDLASRSTMQAHQRATISFDATAAISSRM
ncbi:hypothetical protein [Mesorhizobium sp. GbtcB19]|uniref:4Fe-4S binding protein n=1 Tax=Mesorhizobium sp. GbtcB19 TaxID=2824764 RepID=UPI001C2FDADF|nr:hypothetical protein [Mesorhizobium sp. GbtcB19]